MPDSRLDIPGPRLREGDEPPALQVVVREGAWAVAVVEVSGHLDTTTAQEFDEWVRGRWDGADDVVLDLDGVTFLASAGIGVLIGLRLAAQRRGLRLHLTGRTNRAVWRPLQVVGLLELLDLQNDPAAAVAARAPSG